MDISIKKFINIVVWACIFAAFTVLTAGGIFKNIDTAVADTVTLYSNPSSDRLFSAIRSLGSLGLCILLAATASLYAFFKRSKKFGIFLVVIFVLLVGAGHELKNTIKKERPAALYYRKDVKSYSYPSGHSSRTLFLFFAMGMLLNKTKLSERKKQVLRGVFYALIILIGFSSIYLRAHWLSDIIGAYMLGYIFFLIFKNLVDKSRYF